MDIRQPITTNGGDGLKKFGSLWERQVSQIREKWETSVLWIQMPGQDRTDVPTFLVKKDSIIPFLKFLKEEPGFEYQFLVDLTATDEQQDPRFFVVYHLYSLLSKARLRIKVSVAEGDGVPTSVPLWPGADWAEREVYDMFGIVFVGHPDLRRILMDERWQGYPLRKDYPLKGFQIFTEPMPIDPVRLEKAGSPKIVTVGKGMGSHSSSLSDPDELWTESRITVNIGPTHPAMHGALRVVAELNGETIEKSYSEFGYTHRAKEKLGENRTFHNFIVYTDRLNYCSALLNNVVYVMSVERLMGVEVPERCIWIRMICCELSRVIDHLICIGISAVDLGAFSFFLYGFHQREAAYTLIEKLCGARLTTSYPRVGGLMADAPDGFERELKAWIHETRRVVDEMDRLLTQNKIWHQRTVGVGVFNKEQCLQYSYTGPNARAAGLDMDLRRDQPCMFYRHVEFDVPVTKNGDVYDRYRIRLFEIQQSLNILSQCADKMKKGPIWSEDKRVRIPDKEVVYNTMEGMINHFKFFMTGFEVPAGEAYTSFEASNGELGFYIVSKGASRAHRMRIRGPSVWHYQGLSPMVQGAKIADLVAALGSINIIAGELDR